MNSLCLSGDALRCIKILLRQLRSSREGNSWQPRVDSATGGLRKHQKRHDCPTQQDGCLLKHDTRAMLQGRDPQTGANVLGVYKDGIDS